jgi:nickel superoxide dismutase
LWQRDLDLARPAVFDYVATGHDNSTDRREHTMKTVRLAWILLAVSLVMASGSAALAHCQIPCGIYDDALRFTQMREHVTTIEKSMNQINSLGGEKAKDYNQIVRWVMNKEKHSDDLAEIVTYYFMAQRIKMPTEQDDEVTKKYVGQLTLLHGMLIQTMKTKQTTDLAHIKQLNELIDKFEEAYLGHTH